MAAVRRKRRARPAVEVSSKKVKVKDPFEKARVRIRNLIEKTASNKPPWAVGLVLALVTQETGNHRAANEIIEEFGLDKKFGLQKFKAHEAKAPHVTRRNQSVGEAKE